MPWCCSCNGTCNGQEEPDSPLVAVADPASGRTFVFTTKQFNSNRPELLFLDFPFPEFRMLAIKLVDDIEAGIIPVPADMQEKTAGGGKLSFTYRFYEAESEMVADLRRFYFHKHTPHGILVQIPSPSNCWGTPPIPYPTEQTREAMDNFVRAHIEHERRGVQMVGEMIQAAGGHSG